VDGTPALYHRLPPARAVVRPPSAPALRAPPRYSLGHQRLFFAYDFEVERQYIVTSTLRAVGDYAYVYVADGQWEQRVTQEALDRLLRGFERETPADPTRGVYQTLVDAFGNPPDVDGDARIVILLLDILDRSTSGKPYIAGYFLPVNQGKDVLDPRGGPVFRSNETEMLYVDTNPLDTAGPLAVAMLAHELQHLIHHAVDPGEEVWLNEAASEFAMFLCGYPPSNHVRNFERRPSISLTMWPTEWNYELAHYGAAYLWMLYLYERYGGLDTIQRLVRSPLRGMGAVEHVLTTSFAALDEVFDDWRIALIVDDPMYGDGRFGFRAEDVRVRGRTHSTYPLYPESRDLDVWAGDVLEFTPPAGGASPLQVDVTFWQSWDLVALDVREDLLASLSVRALLFQDERIVGVLPVPADPVWGRYTRTFDGFGRESTRVVLSTTLRPQGMAFSGTRYQYKAWAGELPRFELIAFRNPLQRSFVEVLAVPLSPLPEGAPLLRLTRPGEQQIAFSRHMVRSNAGRLFALTFRIPKDLESDWTWELTFSGHFAGSGALAVKE
jgi:hypothetical protein